MPRQVLVVGTTLVSAALCIHAFEFGCVSEIVCVLLHLKMHLISMESSSLVLCHPNFNDTILLYSNDAIVCLRTCVVSTCSVHTACKLQKALQHPCYAVVAVWRGSIIVCLARVTAIVR